MIRRLRRAFRFQCHHAQSTVMRITPLDVSGMPSGPSATQTVVLGYCTRPRWHRGIHNGGRNLGGPK